MSLATEDKRDCKSIFSARQSALVMILLGIKFAISEPGGKVREQQELSEHSKEEKLGVRPDPPLSYSWRLAYLSCSRGFLNMQGSL